MAAFDYRCPECGRLVELDFPIGKAPQSLPGYCPACDSEREMIRVYSVAGIVFRGGGWGGKPDPKHPSNTVSLDEAKALGYKGVDPRDVVE